MKDKFIVSPAPHIHDSTSIPKVMWNVVIALLPALAFSPYRDWETDRKSTRLNSSHITRSRMPSSA